jgi:two-component system, NtrC family, sensor kinase
MRFRSKILIVLVTASVAPVVLLGALSYRANRQELADAVGAAQLRAAEDMVAQAEAVVLDTVRDLDLAAHYIPFAQLTPVEAGAALQIPGRQFPGLAALALLDESGVALAPPLVRRAAGGEAAALADFARHVPLQEVLASGRAVGEPYTTADGPRVALAVRVAGTPMRVLAAELSLEGTARRLDEEARRGDAAALLDGSGEPLAVSAPDGDAALSLARASAAGVRTVEREGEEWLVARARAPVLGWSVVLARPGAVAFGPARRVRLYTAFWAVVALGLAVGLGLLLGRGLAGPIADLSEAAKALTAGRYDRAADEVGGDELGDLARAFNHMSREVRRRDDEIRRWNAELSERVERQTAELHAAEEQVARARRLAAVGSLGAGVAHRINNPLAAVVGLVALARAGVGPDTEEGRCLGDALLEARRVAAVVEELRALAEREVNEAGHPFALPGVVEAALAGRRERAAAQGITVELEVALGLRSAQGDPRCIEEVVAHLVDNAIEAMPGGGVLSVSLAAVDGEALRLRVSDTGPGVPPEARDRVFDPLFGTKGQAGMGLTACHRIVEEHHGRIDVDAEPGAGARFTVILPAAPAPAHIC